MSKISWFFSMRGNYSLSLSALRVILKTARDSCFQQKKSPRVPPQGQYMRQHGKIWKNTSKKSFRTMFSDEFFRFFPEAPRPSQGKIWRFLKVFRCPEAPGTIPEWSWMNLGNIIFSWKFLKKWSLKVRPTSQKTHMYIHSEPKVEKDYNCLNHFTWMFLISSNSNDRILRKSQNKIEKGTFGDVED